MSGFLEAVRLAVSSNDGESLSNYLSLIGLPFKSFQKMSETPLGKYVNPYFDAICAETLQTDVKWEERCSQIISKPYDEVVLQYILILKELTSPFESNSGKMKAMFLAQNNLVFSFLKSFGSSDGNWELSVMRLLTTNLRLMAFESDKANACNESCENAARILPRLFTITLTDKAPLESSKKWGCLHIVNCLFKIYFRLNNLRLCNNVLRALENPQVEFIKLEDFPKSDHVTFKYLRARIALNQNDFFKAQDLLLYAFNHCNKENFNNKRIILSYLVVLNAIFGLRPKIELLVKYNLKSEFGDLMDGVFSGNIEKFRRAISDNQEFYINKELYLLIQSKLKNVLYRNLFKKVYLISTKISEIDSRLPLSLVERAMKYLRVDTNLDELECIMISMINENYVKGYVSHQYQTVVLSKRMPFPKLTVSS